MAVKGILTVIDELRREGKTIRMVLRDGQEIAGTWQQTDSPDWISTTDRKFWIRMSTVDRFEVSP